MGKMKTLLSRENCTTIVKLGIVSWLGFPTHVHLPRLCFSWFVCVLALPPEQVCAWIAAPLDRRGTAPVSSRFAPSLLRLRVAFV